MPLPPLSAADFPACFAAIHGVPPFPWQERLLAEVLAHGWTRAIAVPTASGKTSVLDVAVFALACQADLPGDRRTAPRRIALVVDRRIVVDGAFERAERIRQGIDDPDLRARVPALAALHDRLLALGGEQPLATALLRGGIYREDRWARSPAQPVILCSTVDQIGSRLLFRGYGLSNHAWPIHAGLLGNDTLIILDEAHCSRPFLQTMEWIRRCRQVADQPVPTPFAAIPMTATPAGGGEPFRLDDADRAHPVLRARLTAAKPITLADPCGDKDQDIADAAVPHLADLPAGALALVVLNRVAAARALHRRLHEMATRKKDPLAAEVLLLIGRSRSVERDRLIADHWDRLRAGRDRKVGVAVKPLIVVATQCIEVGADLDADLLVSECCPLDALRQRLGRLDRLGRLAAETGRTARAVVICRKSMAWAGTGEPPEDLLYGPAVARTWHWLTQHRDGLDGGIAALDQRLVGVEPALMSAPTVDAPVIFPAYCDLWAQTGPAPAASPDPAIFLALMQVRRQLDGVMG